MIDPVSKKWRLTPAVLWVFMIAAPRPEPLLGQVLAPRTPVSTADVYGNARPPYRDRRRMNAFQNETQRFVSRGFQDLGRRTDRRGGFSPFALPGDARGRGGLNLTHLPADPFIMSSRFARGQRAPDPFGNFAVRLDLTGPVSLDALLKRPGDLVATTALNAPVRRALLRSGIDLALRTAIEGTPAVNKPPPAETGSELRIDRWLRTGIEAAHERMRDDAWAWFRAGRYRRAARAFEAATLLDDDDVRSRVGELFSHLSLGASWTALAVLRELSRRSENPFLPGLNVMNTDGDPKNAARIRTGVGFPTAFGAVDQDRKALRAIVLWYFDERDEALAEAVQLARDSPGGLYGAWPALMREAQAGYTAGNGAPAP